MFTKTVITLSFGVRVGPISTQTARGERANQKNAPRLRQEARSALKYGLKQDFWPWKSKNIIRRCFSDKFLNRLAPRLEGYVIDYVPYRH